MNKSESFEKLKSIGAQKIHEKTHISKYHVQALLHNNFDDMTKIQFLGFVSILEREYNLHLDELREHGLEYFFNEKIKSEDNCIFIQPTKTRSNALLYIVLAILLIIIGMIYSFVTAKEPKIESITIQSNKTIKTVQEDILGISSDLNSTDIEVEDLNKTVVIEQEAIEENSLIIMPNSKLWIGYIDIDKGSKLQTTTSKPLELDPNKNWLLSLGHADVNIELHGELIEYKKSTNIRFLYRDKELNEISFSEFKRLNKGAIW